MRRFATISVLLAVAATGGGCKDPTADKAKAVVGAATEPATTSDSGAVFVLRPGDSKVQFTGYKVTGQHEGTFQTFSGKVTVPEGAITKASIEADIDLGSVLTDQEKLNNHLKSPDFFDVAKFPRATFRSTRIEAGGPTGAMYTIHGNIDLHGFQKSLAFPATISLAGDTLEASAEFSLNRKDFGIQYPGMPDDLIRDGVLVRLTVKAKKQ